MKDSINYHIDPGHGWIAVPKAELKTLGIEEKISSCSYMNGSTAYLEEDLDAGIYLNAREAQGYGKPTFACKHHDRSWYGRDRYQLYRV